MKGVENVKEAEAKIETDTTATVSTDEMAIAAQASEGESSLPSQTTPCESNDSQMDTSPNETALTESSESKMDVSESDNKIDHQTENITLEETKEPKSGHSDVLPVLTEEVQSSPETTEHAENLQMETTEQSEDVPVNINEQSENLRVDTNEQAENSKMDITEQDENTPVKTTQLAEESSLEGAHPSQPKDASKAGDLSAEQEEVEDRTQIDASVAQLPSVGDTETAALTGSENEGKNMEPVLENEPQLAPIEESVQDSEATQGSLSPQSTKNQNEVQLKDELKVCEQVLPDTTPQSSNQNQAEKATTQQGALPADDTTLGFPPVTQEILKALEAAVHQCRLQSSMKRAEEEASQKPHVEKNSAEKEVSQVTKTNRQKPQAEKERNSQSTRTTRSQRRKMESPERELSSRQRGKGSPKDGSPATSNEGSSSSSTTSRKTRSEGSTTLRHSREREEDGYKVRMTITYCYRGGKKMKRPLNGDHH